MMEMGVLEEEEELEGFMEIDGNDGIGRISCGGLQGVFSMLDHFTLIIRCKTITNNAILLLIVCSSSNDNHSVLARWGGLAGGTGLKGASFLATSSSTLGLSILILAI